jgi:hypothetical protein
LKAEEDAVEVHFRVAGEDILGTTDFDLVRGAGKKEKMALYSAAETCQ